MLSWGIVRAMSHCMLGHSHQTVFLGSAGSFKLQLRVVLIQVLPLCAHAFLSVSLRTTSRFGE